MKYNFQYVSKINIFNIRDDLGLKKENDFIQCIKLFDNKILICNSKIIKIYKFPLFRLIAHIYTPGKFFSATLLKSKNLACCQHDGKISIYSIENDKPKLLQTIEVLKGKTIYRVKELPNNMLVSCQDESAISFYEFNKINELYNIKQKIKFQYFIDNILYTKDNDILLFQNLFYSMYNSKFILVLFDFIKKREKKEIVSSCGNGLIYEPFKFLNKNIVAVIINKYICLIDINKDYSIIEKIEIKESYWLNSICVIKNNFIVTGDSYGKLILWEFKDNQLSQKNTFKYDIKKKETWANSSITDLLYLGNNLFFVGGIYYNVWFPFSNEKPPNPFSGYINDLFKVI